ncbi:MAG: hypothetical protein H7Y89_10070 [Steroidobacteraceae bacterium]|nr:hypothetical protein [Steroidobacteraceae bacterium]
MRWLMALGLGLACGVAHAQTSAEEDAAVGQSINYVFATDLGSGVYDLGGRTLQIYRYTYLKDLRETRAGHTGVRFVLPVTAGFFDFSPVDVIAKGPPSRVDSVSVVPGVELDIVLRDGWHLLPYVRAGFSVASSSVDGWLYGTGARLERQSDFHGWNAYVRSEVAYAGVKYTNETPDDEFFRLRQAFDLTRATRLKIRGREIETGLYAIFDLVVDPPTAPVAGAKKVPIQAEFGVTLSSRPRVKIWKFDAPRIGVGYRMAGELSSWRLLIGTPF